MSVRFFGQFLLEKGVITARQLLDAAEYQETKNLKFGEFAVSKGFLTELDVQKINEEQKKSDLFFGEVAVRLGILTPDKVKEILTMQKNDRVFIGQVLVEKGVIAEDALERELALFKEDQNKYADEDLRLPAEIKRPDMVKSSVEITKRMLKRIASMNAKVDDIFVSKKEPMIGYGAVTIRLNGSFPFEYNLLTSPGVAREIAAGILGKTFADESPEVIIDAVREFCNICCGNIVAKMAQKGHTLAISPPEMMVHRGGKYKPVKGRDAVYCPLFTTHGDVTLILI